MRTMTISLLVLACASTAFAFEVPESVALKYRYLDDLRVETAQDGSKSIGSARLLKREGIHILSLEGDDYEMAYQHGKLLRDEIAAGALPQTALLLRNNALNAFPDIPVVTDTAISAIYQVYTRAMIAFATDKLRIQSDQFLAFAYGLSRGSGRKLDEVLYALMGPETLQVMLGERSKGNAALPAPTAVNECTDFAAPEKSNNGVIVGRNTDYPLNGTFDRYPTVIYYNPTDGSQKYMSVTSAGLHTAGVVGFNESGLYLGIHTIPTLEVSKSGVPAFYIGEQVLKRARTFDEAVEVFRSFKPAAGWTYTLVSAKERRYGSVEMTNMRMAVRESTDPWHAQSNHFMTPELTSANLDLSATVNEDSSARFERAKALIKGAGGSLSIEDAVSILGDKTDPVSGKIRGIGNVIAVHTTLTSAVFDTATGRVYVANGKAPVSLSAFVELPLVTHFDGAAFMTDKFRVIDNSGYHRTHRDISRAEQKYIEAKEAFESELNPAKAAEILDLAGKLDPSNDVYPYMSAVMLLKGKQMTEASRRLWGCAERMTGHYQLACRYFLGRVALSKGQRSAALTWLDGVIKDGDPKTEAALLKAAKKARRAAASRGVMSFNPQSLTVFMPEADVLGY